MLAKVVYAGSHDSFPRAAQTLQALAEVDVSAQRVRRATIDVGAERVAQSETAADAYQALPLPSRQESPVAQVPQVACVQMDGGRIQIRDRQQEPASNLEGEKGRFWRESKVGCLLSMSSSEWTCDPCPTIPATFVDAARMSQISREIKGFSASAPSGEQGQTEQPPAVDDRLHRPLPLVKSVVATRGDIHVFGRRLIAAAYERGFNAAQRKAFVADGAAANWTVWRKHFSHYTPILDFTHAICYVYAAARVGRNAAEGWQDYCRWAQWTWAGQVERVIEALRLRQQQLGPPRQDDPPNSAAQVVADTLRYLTNQQTRMHYDQYRRRGLPITSSYIESTIKQINRRVKGSEKFWAQGAEPLLQLAADHLSQTKQLDRFWKQRPETLTGVRCYHTTG